MYRSSYSKTAWFFAALALASIAALLASSTLAPMIATILMLILAPLAVVAIVIAIAGWVVLYRDARISNGRTDLFVRANLSCEEAAVTARPDTGLVRVLSRSMRRMLSGQSFVVGDVVEVLSAEEIAKTLDADGCLDGLPFQPEMVQFCGRRFRVFRNIDKILDYGGTKGMRRLHHAVSLVDIRCDGVAHDGCEARCYLLWKCGWLRRVAATQRVSSANTAPNAVAIVSLQNLRTKTVSAAENGCLYNCQFTKLASITPSIPMSDKVAYLRPLLSGNLTLAGFLVAALTRLFNYIQWLRSGVGYPVIATDNRTATPTAATGIAAGSRVRVLPLEQISKTLDKRGKNRGMGFTGEMAKYCGQEYAVESAITRIIDDASGRMLQMKYPCLVLKGVRASGETELLCGQHELIYWREVWFEKLS